MLLLINLFIYLFSQVTKKSISPFETGTRTALPGQFISVLLYNFDHARCCLPAPLYPLISVGFSLQRHA